MTDSMTQLEREELAERLNNLSPTKKKEFLLEKRNIALIESVLQNMANQHIHKKGPHKGKVKVTELSKLLGLKKGGAITDALIGRRDLPKGTRLKLIDVWSKMPVKKFGNVQLFTTGKQEKKREKKMKKVEKKFEERRIVSEAEKRLTSSKRGEKKK